MQQLASVGAYRLETAVFILTHMNPVSEVILHSKVLKTAHLLLLLLLEILHRLSVFSWGDKIWPLDQCGGAFN